VERRVFYRVGHDVTECRGSPTANTYVHGAASPDGKGSSRGLETTDTDSAAVYAFPLGGASPSHQAQDCGVVSDGRFLSLALPFTEGRTYFFRSVASGQVTFTEPLPPAGLFLPMKKRSLGRGTTDDALRSDPPSPYVYAFSSPRQHTQLKSSPYCADVYHQVEQLWRCPSACGNQMPL